MTLEFAVAAVEENRGLAEITVACQLEYLSTDELASVLQTVERAVHRLASSERKQAWGKVQNAVARANEEEAHRRKVAYMKSADADAAENAWLASLDRPEKSDAAE